MKTSLNLINEAFEKKYGKQGDYKSLKEAEISGRSLKNHSENTSTSILDLIRRENNLK